jgi:ABC-type tungstate transport system substrate-binding protein
MMATINGIVSVSTTVSNFDGKWYLKVVVVVVSSYPCFVIGLWAVKLARK